MELLHGGNIYDENITVENGEILDFSANINPLGMPKGVRRAVIESAASGAAERYPDPLCRELRAALSDHYKLPPEYFICGNGGAELIYRLARAVQGAAEAKPRRPQTSAPRRMRALLTAPAFAEYELALRQVGAEITFHEMQGDMEVQDDILARMDEPADVMFLCNPNNPTGLFIEPELLLRILEKAERRGILLALDECFLDFTGQEERSLVGRTKEYRQLFILKSFTKLYAMPGLRLGYGISGNRELLERMEAAGQCWSVSVPASKAGIAALKEQEYKERSVRTVSAERAYLKKELEVLGFTVWDGAADYLFFRVPGMYDLCSRLREYGILLRHCGNYRGLDDSYYRTAVKLHEDNVRLVESLKEIMINWRKER